MHKTAVFHAGTQARLKRISTYHNYAMLKPVSSSLRGNDIASVYILEKEIVTLCLHFRKRYSDSLSERPQKGQGVCNGDVVVTACVPVESKLYSRRLAAGHLHT